MRPVRRQATRWPPSTSLGAQDGVQGARGHRGVWVTGDCGGFALHTRTIFVNQFTPVQIIGRPAGRSVGRSVGRPSAFLSLRSLIIRNIAALIDRLQIHGGGGEATTPRLNGSEPEYTSAHVGLRQRFFGGSRAGRR